MQASIKSHRFYFFWAAYLVFLKEEKPKIYSEAIAGDHSKIRDLLTSELPPVRLSFFTVNVLINELFLRYVNLFRSGSEQARKAAREVDEDRPFLYAISDAFAQDYASIASYPKLVDLSYHLQ